MKRIVKKYLDLVRRKMLLEHEMYLDEHFARATRQVTERMPGESNKAIVQKATPATNEYAKAG